MSKKFLVGHSSYDLFAILHDAGLFSDNPHNIRRVVLDLEVGSAARVYVERFVDESLGEILAVGLARLKEQT